MSISFVCACGAPYKVSDALGGKKVRCKHCGATSRVPAAAAASAAPVGDLYGLDDVPPPPRRVEAPEPAPAAARSRAPDAPAKRPKSTSRKFARRLSEALPGVEDMNYPIVGAVVLVASIVAWIVGTRAAVALYFFLWLAAPASMLWLCVASLTVAAGKGTRAALTLVPGLAAMGLVFWLMAQPSPSVTAMLAAGLTALGFFAATVVAEKRSEDYRQPIAVGVMTTLLMVSLALMLFKSRYQSAHPELFFSWDTPSADAQPAFPSPAPAPAPAPAAAPAAEVSPLQRIKQAIDGQGKLEEARRGFHARPISQPAERMPLDRPPNPRVFSIVKYDSPAGRLAAYLTPDPGDGQKHPAIVWITGGDCNSINDMWSAAPRSNDQTASAYRKAGIVMMFPSLRGGNENPGNREAFLGEIDDVLAAGDYLAAQDYVDPARVYLGGHSTGGTVVLLAAESTDKFRAVFSFGPASDVRGYGPEYAPFDHSDPAEALVRSPIYWLHSVRCPTFVFEGDQQANDNALRAMQTRSTNPLIRFYTVAGANHFDILDPTNRLIARRIKGDDGPTTNLSFTAEELKKPFGR